MPRVQITLDGWLCARCGHKWVPRYYFNEGGMVPPKVCPHCKSPYWDTEPKRRARRAEGEPSAVGGYIDRDEVERIVLDMMAPPAKDS